MLRIQNIANPKRHPHAEEAAEKKLFPYYAGFSSAFIESLLPSLELHHGARVLDPWNGSGTTTTAVFNQGLTAIGSDLNPVMVLVGKAALVSRLDIESLVPLAHSIVAKLSENLEAPYDDPMNNWFHPKSAGLLRGLEDSINRTLVSHDVYTTLDSPEAIEKVTPLAAFFYLALFRVVRRWAQNFIASNPTWIRIAKNTNERKRLTRREIVDQFVQEMKSLCERRERFPIYRDSDQERVKLLLSSAEALPLQSKSVNAVIGSPPYCTRIDYAVMTYIELAVLRFGKEKFAALRNSLTGTSTVSKTSIEIDLKWGLECGKFLHSLYRHPSKASKTYYFKSHLQYFDSLYRSLNEISRVLLPKASCVLVVQNSYYKQIRNDIAMIVTQMAENLGMSLETRADFATSRSMVGVNPHSKKYLDRRSTIESVLCFKKE